MKTPRINKALEALNENLRRSAKFKKLIQQLMYDSYVAFHMAKIVQDVEPTCYDDDVGNMEWEKAMDEEMAILGASKR